MARQDLIIQCYGHEEKGLNIVVIQFCAVRTTTEYPQYTVAINVHKTKMY